MLILRQFFKIILIGTLVSVAIFTIPAFAQERNKEMYHWTSYDKIGASLGFYSTMGVADGGQHAVTFTQDEDDPYKFNLEVSEDECEGTITITLDKNTGSRGKLTHTGGKCDKFRRATKNIRIEFLSAAKNAVKNEADGMKQTFVEQECGEEAENQSECESAAGDKHRTVTEECRRQHDYIKHIANGNNYLDCVAEKLGIERGGSPSNESDEQVENSCEIPDVGWVVCQIVEFTANLTDYSFELLRPFLEIEPLTKQVGTTGVDSATFTAWKSLRDVGNVILALGLLVIIYSHLTGLGLSNYHIKKGLPRVIVVSILINISFLLCGLMVDLSNIAGKSIEQLTTPFESTARVSSSPVFNNWTDLAKRIIRITPVDEDFTEQASTGMTDEQKRAAGIILPSEDDTNQSVQNQSQGSDNSSQNTTDDEEEDPANDEPKNPTQMIVNGMLITGPMVLFANLAVLIPIMVFALFAMFTALLILVFRWAIVIILVVISPLAFAAIVLPGTKNLFNKWMSTITQMLMLYPIVALLFTGSRIASDAISESAANNGQSILAILSLGIQVIPLFITPVLLKFSGGLINQFSGRVNALTTPARSVSMKKAKQFQQNRKMLQRTRAANHRAMFGKIAVPKALSNLRPSNIRAAVIIGGQIRKTRLEEVHKKMLAEKTGEYLSGVTDEKLKDELAAQAQQRLDSIENVEVNNAEVMLRRSGADQRQLEDIALTGKDKKGEDVDEATRRAAIRMSVSPDNVQHAMDLIAMSGETMTLRESQTLVSALRENGVTAKASFLGASALNAIQEGKVSGYGAIDNMVVSGINSHAFSVDKIGQQDPVTLSMIERNLSSESVSDKAASQVIQDAKSAVTGSSRGKISSGAKTALQRIIRKSGEGRF